MRNVQKHLCLVSKKYFRVHYSGAYALWELGFGRIGHGEFVILLGCTDRLVNWTYNRRMTPKKETWKDGVAY